MSEGTPARVTLASLVPHSLWVAWQTEMRFGGKKPTKVPYNPSTNGKAKADDPQTWGPRDAATARAERLAKPFDLGGVGLQLGSLGDGRHLCGIDLDTCRNPETGAIENWALAIIDRLSTYTEVSPSRTGVKLFLLHAEADRDRLQGSLGTTSTGDWKHGASWSRKTGDDHPPAIELHLSNRYFAVTDELLPDSTDEVRLVAAEDLLQIIEADGPAFLCDDADDDEADAAIAAQGRGTPGRQRSKRNIVGYDKSRSGLAFKVGAKARRDGADFASMCEAIRTDPNTAEWYAEKGHADDQRELRRIWDKTDPFGGDLILAAGAPVISAEQFIGRHHTAEGTGWSGALRTLHHQNSTFYTWEGSHYAETSPELVRAALYAFLKKAMTFRGEELVAFDPTKNKVANVVDATAAEAQLPRGTRPPAWLGTDQSPPPSELIACRNGLLHLPTRRLLLHTPAFFTLNALTFAFDAQALAPSAWLAFLASVWPDDPAAVATLQDLFGLLLTADTSHQKAFLIVGPKRSGKGTIARVLTELLGAANVCNPTLSSISTNFGISPLIGKRLAVISDARLSGKADQAVIAERLLAITGEDAQTVDRKFREPWTGRLNARFLVLTNELPRLTDSSGALANRFIILKMQRSFYGNEDRGLLGKVTQELPGILLWAIEGLQRLQTRGHFVPPASSQAAMDELEELGSPIGAFLRDCCTVGPGMGVWTDDLYVEWCDWCRQHGRDHSGTTQTFSRDLGAAVPGLATVQKRRKGKQTRMYEGVGLSLERTLSRSVPRDDALCTLSPEYHPDDPGPSSPY